MTRTVTVIGGGTGSFNVLRGLRDHNLRIRSIVSMMDSGGDSGRLRDEFGVLPPGDVRRCLAALSEETELVRKLFSYRFCEPPLEGRNFGNLFLLAMEKISTTPRESIEDISKILKIRGEVHPVTWHDCHLCAELGDGRVVEGEANIDVPKHDASLPIERVYLKPPARANPQAVDAIATSDFVVLAPGDLYTSTIANLIVDGVAEALAESTAPLIYVLNLMTKYGETSGYSASHHVERIAQYGRRVPDLVLAHEGEIPGELLSRYEAERTVRVAMDREAVEALGVGGVHFADVMSATSYLRHDPERVAAALVEIFDLLEQTGR